MVFRRRVHFFECHSLLGNKWTYISELFHNKSAKQMKNHFYSSIVKTLRKISKNKFDSDMKDTIITYYSLIYLKKIVLQFAIYEYVTEHSQLRSHRFKERYIKKYIISHHIDYKKIISFEAEFEKKIKEKLNFPSFTVNQIPNIFNALVKVKLLYKSIDVLKNKAEIKSKNVDSLENFVNSF